MAELDTMEKVQADLGRIEPTRHFQVTPIGMAWIAIPILTAREKSAGMGLGSTKWVVDSETGVVTEYPSWSVEMVSTAHTEAKATGRSRGRQIYPFQWRIVMRRVRESAEIVTYQMKAVSLSSPPKDSEEHPLAITKAPLGFEPTDTLSRMATVKLVQLSRQNQGIWPEEAMTEF